MKCKIGLSLPALDDLKDVEAYISRDNPETAKKFCHNLLWKVKLWRLFLTGVTASNEAMLVFLFIAHTSFFMKLMQAQAVSKSFASGTVRAISAACA